MQRLLPSGIAAVLSIIALTIAPACKDDKADESGKEQAGKQPEQKSADDGAVAASGGATANAGANAPGAEAGAGDAGAGETGAAKIAGAGTEAGELAADETGAAEPAEDVIPGLLEQAKNLDTDDDAAKKALADAVAAGAAKLDAAKIANERGEALMADGEGERAAVFFQWAADTHKIFAKPIYNLATLAAYAGDLEIAKEHLQELAKRGNKKLMKKVGVDPAFALLADDPEVRKIYEQ